MSELTPSRPQYYEPIKQKFLLQTDLKEEVFYKEASFAAQIMDQNKYLQSCSKESIWASVINIAQTGLTLNPVSKYAYLVPRDGKCVLDPSYMGLVKLLTDSGSVRSINCQLIYEGDDIQVDLTSDKKIISHIPYIITGRDKGKIKAVYSIATLHDSSFHCEIMSRKDVEEIREISEAYKAYKNPNKPNVKSCIWVTHEGEMFRKTCIKRHFKHLPKSDKLDKFNKAVDLSNHAAGYNETISYQLVGHIESLIHASTLSEEEKTKLEGEIFDLQYTSQGNKMVNYLLQYQPKPGLETDFSSQAQIMEATKQRADREP